MSGTSKRHFGAASTGGPFHTPDSVLRLGQLVLPLRVGPYFATRVEDPVLLGEYAEFMDRQVVRDECRTWARLGTDQGFELCVDAEGAVRAVLLDWEEESRYVSSSPEAFAAALSALDEALRFILATDDPERAGHAFAQLKERLHSTDAQAFAGRENWWPLVLDDIRDTASAEWFTAFEVVNGQDEKQIVTAPGGIGVHPEEKLWEQLRAAGFDAEQVLRIHTELQPCFTPGHYCSMWLGQVFPDAQMTHNFPYGESADSRAEGMRQLREAAAQQQ
ncbi:MULTISPECIES: nucleic acid/nucleotide deaminase domain-containing protein [unclassified Streptomyces]|uniref:nucleic acid/nucleotide deaminase domain-containing protein n=1 Tax=unclassified Streptomyces TaxID=2593676 RepID=UPI00278BB86A|nr:MULTISPECIES: nucleic acid/nucleotide deaminase domain-containing protein [unclassified Streptomyces]